MFIPAINWPAELREQGPTVDPTIMLVGEAKIGSTNYTLTAIRVNKYGTAPDYHEGIDERLYECLMADALDTMDFLVETADPALLPLEGGQYLFWMTPEDI